MASVDSTRRTTTDKLPQVWGDVPARNPHFTGREGLLGHLHDQLRAARETAVLPQALHGMGGVGKSQVAIEYVHRHSSEFDLIWWIPAEQPGQILASLTKLAQRLELAVGPEANNAVPAVREALSTGRLPYENWLLVFDNAEDLHEVRAYFPTGGAGKILVTSRNPEWKRVARALEVDVFTREESKELLTHGTSGLSDSDADRLAEALGDLPLAVEHAAAWRAATGMQVDKYLELLEKRGLLDDGWSPDYPVSVSATWNVSLDRLGDVNPAALQVLQLCSFFAPEPISPDRLAAAPHIRIVEPLNGTRRDPIGLGRAFRDIKRYALAKVDEQSGTLQIHRLVRAVLVRRMDDNLREVMQRGAKALLADAQDHGAAIHPQRTARGRTSSRAPASAETLVVVLTALELEYNEVRAHLVDPRTHRTAAGTVFAVGLLAGSDVRVAVAVVGVGTAGAAALTEQAISEFQPDAVLFVGIAGGFHADLDFGDVVVAIKVYAYHGAKEDDGGVHYRPEAWEPPHHLVQLARMVARDDSWTGLIREGARRGSPKVHFKPIASGEVLLNSLDAPIAKWLRRTYNDAAAVEMESAGAAKAGQLRGLPTMTIRGVSDKANGAKQLADVAGWQVTAAANAAAFAAALIAEIARSRDEE